MKRSTLLGSVIGMFLLIMDSRCATQSAADALDLCLKTVIPSLFPMFVLSGFLVGTLQGNGGKILSLLERWVGLPTGGGMLFLLGIVGGFPVGAQCIAQAVEAGSLSQSDGEKMLGFCNNCSPAFLFGIAGSVLASPHEAVYLFLIQLETALLIARFTYFHKSSDVRISAKSIFLPEAVNRAIRSMCTVCAWVVLAGVVTGFLRRWIFPLLPVPAPHILTGLLEITGGVLGLAALPEVKIRFVLCTGFVCFGGLSVWLQIHGLASPRGLSTDCCCRQKCTQCLLGILIASGIVLIGPMALSMPVFLLLIRKKRLEKPVRNVYNGSHKGGYANVVP